MEEIKEETFESMMRILDESKLKQRSQKVEKVYQRYKVSYKFGEESLQKFINNYVCSISSIKEEENAKVNKIFVEKIIIPMLDYSH